MCVYVYYIFFLHLSFCITLRFCTKDFAKDYIYYIIYILFTYTFLQNLRGCCRTKRAPMLKLVPGPTPQPLAEAGTWGPRHRSRGGPP